MISWRVRPIDGMTVPDKANGSSAFQPARLRLYAVELRGDCFMGYAGDLRLSALELAGRVYVFGAGHDLAS